MGNKYGIPDVPADGDNAFRRKAEEAARGLPLDALIRNASKQIEESVIGVSPLYTPRVPPPAFQTRIPDRGPLGDREAHMKAGLNPNSLLRAGSSNVFHKDPTSGRVRASRPGDAPETLFQVG